jgi:hypothetical protein
VENFAEPKKHTTRMKKPSRRFCRDNEKNEMVSLTHGLGEGAWRIGLCRACTKKHTTRNEKDVWGVGRCCRDNERKMKWFL